VLHSVQKTVDGFLAFPQFSQNLRSSAFAVSAAAMDVSGEGGLSSTAEVAKLTGTSSNNRQNKNNP
jgi:hypothetical protein